jgi:hypothetical protein
MPIAHRMPLTPLLYACLADPKSEPVLPLPDQRDICHVAHAAWFV